MSASLRVSASPAQVREWAEKTTNPETGLPYLRAGQRGRLGAPVIKAYNKSHAVKHTENAYVPTVKHTAKPAKGRKVTKTINLAQVRAAAQDAGVKVGARGTLPTAVLDAYVLGTLSTLAQAPESE